ncbi:hypothetical protein COCON_G00228870 [Conger conger]|uniref:Uncharacterized protein n=1 Tax=Conger conger TaxID=82655 RepID=A0A9Q1CV46_CONCO|nr:hypothetical protein COCON_G00228870 [Conger conger]
MCGGVPHSGSGAAATVWPKTVWTKTRESACGSRPRGGREAPRSAQIHSSFSGKLCRSAPASSTNFLTHLSAPQLPGNRAASIGRFLSLLCLGLPGPPCTGDRVRSPGLAPCTLKTQLRSSHSAGHRHRPSSTRPHSPLSTHPAAVQPRLAAHDGNQSPVNPNAANVTLTDTDKDEQRNSHLLMSTVCSAHLSSTLTNEPLVDADRSR